MKKILLTIIILFLGATSAQAGTYWVSSTGTAPWTGGSSCAGESDPSRYCALSTANTNAVAGDTIYIKAGTYTYASGTAIRPTNSGTSAAARITYSRAPGEAKPVFNIDAATFVNLSSRSYVKVDGLIANGSSRTASVMLDLQSAAHYNEITNVELQGTPLKGLMLGQTGVATHNWIHNNILVGQPGTGCSEGGDTIRIGNASNSNSATFVTNNTIEANIMSHGGHSIIDSYGQKYNVFRNNEMHNEPFWTGTMTCGDKSATYTNTAWNGMWGHRVAEIGGNADGSAIMSLVEGNRTSFQSANPGNAGDGNITLAGRGIIVRYNDSISAQRMGIAIKSLSDAQGKDCRIYNNTVYKSGYGFTGGGAASYWKSAFWNFTGSTGNIAKNNIAYDTCYNDSANAGTCSGNYDFENGFQTYVATSNNLCTWSQTGCTQYGDPVFKDGTTPASPSPTQPDLNLTSSSTKAIGTGTNLTVVDNTDSGSGTTLIVSDSWYFQAGSEPTCGATTKTYSLGSCLSDIQGDWILVGATVATAHQAQIVNIDYTSNILTLSTGFTRSAGDKVWLLKKSDGVLAMNVATEAPDMGAHPYLGSGGGEPPVGDNFPCPQGSCNGFIWFHK